MTEINSQPWVIYQQIESVIHLPQPPSSPVVSAHRPTSTPTIQPTLLKAQSVHRFTGCILDYHPTWPHTKLGWLPNFSPSTLRVLTFFAPSLSFVDGVLPFLGSVENVTIFFHICNKSCFTEDIASFYTVSLRRTSLFLIPSQRNLLSLSILELCGGHGSH